MGIVDFVLYTLFIFLISLSCCIAMSAGKYFFLKILSIIRYENQKKKDYARFKAMYSIGFPR